MNDRRVVVQDGDGAHDPLEVLRALAEAVGRDGGQLRSPYVHVPRGVARSLDESHPGWREQVDPDLVKIQEEE